MSDARNKADLLADRFELVAHRLREEGTFDPQILSAYCAAAAATAALLRKNADANTLIIANASMMFFQGLLEQNQVAHLHALTKLPNRIAFDQELNEISHNLNRDQNHKTFYAIMYFDGDKFKIVNDTLGHAGGDAALIRLKEMFVESARVGEHVFHWGGDEFAVLMHDQKSNTPQEAEEHFKLAAERFRKKFDLNIFEFNGQKVPLTGSFGFHTIKPEDFTGQETPEELKEKIKAFGDAALYKDKEENRNDRQARAWAIIADESNLGSPSIKDPS